MTVGRRLEGRVAMITGGASGIGAASARLFAEHGAGVAIADVNDNLGRQVADEISAAGGSALYRHLDTSSEEEWREVMAAVLERFGRLDIMLNAAGVSGRGADGATSRPIADLDLDNWDHVMAVNATGVFLGTKHAIEPMLAAGRWFHHQHLVHLRDRRLDQQCRLSRIEGSGAHVHQVCGGTVRHAGHPGEFRPSRFRGHSDDPADPRRPGAGGAAACPDAGRAIRPGPWDIAFGCLFLASDESAWMTGAELVIDGGMTAV